MFFRILYDLALHGYALTSLPKIAFNPSKYRSSFVQKLGRNFPKIEKGAHPLIWIHAVSVGEVKAVAPLIERIKKKSQSQIILSTTTQAGHQAALKNVPMVDHHVYLPFDFSYIIRPLVKKIAPDLVIITETDFWYHFQDAAKKSGAKLILVNGKLSERSFKRYRQLSFVKKRILNPIDHFYVQGEVYKRRFQELDIDFSKITVTGNLKLDAPSIEQRLDRDQLGYSKNDMILCLGSTHDPEEKIWIKALKRLWKKLPNLKVILAPRHLERIKTIAELLKYESVSFSFWSQPKKKCQILLVDIMGVLGQCYQLSDLTFVGGSLTPKVGGHNILEPSFYGKGVLFGPYMESQPDFLELVLKYRAGIQVSESTLDATVERLLKEDSERQELGENGLKLIRFSRGALDKTLKAVLCLLQKTHS